MKSSDLKSQTAQIRKALSIFSKQSMMKQSNAPYKCDKSRNSENGITQGLSIQTTSFMALVTCADIKTTKGFG